MRTAPATAPLQPRLRRAFAGVWRLSWAQRLTLRHSLAVIAPTALLAVAGYGMLHSRGAHDYLGWIAHFYLSFLVPVVAFIVAAGAIRDDVQSVTTDYVLTRPVPRPAFVLFRYAAHLLGAQLDLLLPLGALIALGLIQGEPGLLAALPRLLLGQALLVTGFSALGFLCAVLTARYVVIGLLYGAIVEVGIGQIPTEVNRVAMTHQVTALLQPILAAGRMGDVTPAMSGSGIPATLAMFAGFTVVCLAAAAAVFTVREWVSAAES